MFSYYGSKSKIVHLYPSPKFDKIIEPFAGSARYALKWFDRDVLLVDKYEVIIKIWQWLQKCSPDDILSLPNLKCGDKINRDDFDCIEQAWLMGFLIQAGVTDPKLTVSKFRDDYIPAQKKSIASQLYKIKHWVIQQGSYEDIQNETATWFIDPPYQVGGKWYSYSEINYKNLSIWCKQRQGQVIVCENTKADWLQFYPMCKMNGTVASTTEAIWSNYPTGFEAHQPPLFVDPPPEA